MDKQLSFKKKEDNCYSLVIKKDSPKDLYENLKIYFAIQFLFSNKNLNIHSLDDQPIKIVLQYNDKELFFYFEKELYERLDEIMTQICKIQDGMKDGHKIDCLLQKNEMELRKCNHCFFMSQCKKFQHL